jgi:hypothetical protein
MVFNSITDNAKNTMNKTKEISKDLFTQNKSSNKPTHTDRVQKTNSAIRKENKYYKPYAEQVREEITAEDVKKLNAIIK